MPCQSQSHRSFSKTFVLSLLLLSLEFFHEVYSRNHDTVNRDNEHSNRRHQQQQQHHPRSISESAQTDLSLQRSARTFSDLQEWLETLETKVVRTTALKQSMQIPRLYPPMLLRPVSSTPETETFGGAHIDTSDNRNKSIFQNGSFLTSENAREDGNINNEVSNNNVMPDLRIINGESVSAFRCNSFAELAETRQSRMNGSTSIFRRSRFYDLNYCSCSYMIFEEKARCFLGKNKIVESAFIVRNFLFKIIHFDFCISSII